MVTPIMNEADAWATQMNNRVCGQSKSAFITPCSSTSFPLLYLPLICAALKLRDSNAILTSIYLVWSLPIYPCMHSFLRGLSNLYFTPFPLLNCHLDIQWPRLPSLPTMSSSPFRTRSSISGRTSAVTSFHKTHHLTVG
jgi:hypothetical protein